MTPESLIRSRETTYNPFNSTTEVMEWVMRRSREIGVRITRVPFSEMSGWHFDTESGDLVHDTGRFFSVVGLDVYTNTGAVSRWMQPIINQPEVGLLGILCREVDGVAYFLLQAKIEPGNVNCVQLSPTLQATRSNYMCAHGGRAPRYLDMFRHAERNCIVLDQLQSEHGSRFLRKRNRNMIVSVEDDIFAGDDFRWLTLGQIKELMRKDNVVNMDTRTVLSGLRAGDCSVSGINSIDDILHRLSHLKSKYELRTEKVGLGAVKDWTIGHDEIYRADRRFFRVIGVSVGISNREVESWCQPLVEPMHAGLCVLFSKNIRGTTHYLLQAKVECGNFDIVELAPTIQCLTGNYLSPVGYAPEYLSMFLDGSCVDDVTVDVMQSEEGGRFFREQNRNVVCKVNDLVPDDPPENFIWLTMGQIHEFLRFNNYLNIQVRSLISML